jgi:hypothetical protein
VLFALAADPAGLRAQGRFEAVTQDPVVAVPGLQIVTVHDHAQNVCYTVFVMRVARPLANPSRGEPTSVEDAAARRDHRLSQLSVEFQRGLPGAVPATLGSDPLRYQWEAQKIQSEFERALREAELARLERWLEQIASAPKLAVSGPVACNAQTTSTPSSPESGREPGSAPRR